MDREQATRIFLRSQCARYTDLRPQDLLKALHQSVFGCGHFVTDEEYGVNFLRQEMLTARAAPGPAVELLDGDYCRIHLAWAKSRGFAPETLFRIFAVSSQAVTGTEEDLRAILEEKLAVLLHMAQEGELPFAYEEVKTAVDAWKEAGYPACRHSEEVRRAWAPAYRVIHTDYLRILHLLADIDRRRAQKSPLVVTLEGGSASGKTTLAALLEKLYDCTVLHMDDFFLRPEQRTEERLATPGGNIDHERFAAEVLEPLKKRQSIQYRRFDCCTRTVLPAVEITPKDLIFVEGAYSMHPVFGDYYDLSVFLDVTTEVQCARIERRNTPEMQERFFNEWIPMEQAYFAFADPKGRCHQVLEVRE